MNVVVVEFFILIFFSICINGEERCTLVDDYEGKNLHEAVCYLSCLSNALNSLYTDGERKLLVNEEVYANASRMLDDMEGKTGESTKYLSVVSSAMGDQHKNLKKLITYGNILGDLVAKVGGLFAEVNESVREVRNVLPDALTAANKYYTAVSEIERTVWDDVKAVSTDPNDVSCGQGKFASVKDFPVTCGIFSCPLRDGVGNSALQRYKDGCLAITVLNGSVSECFNRLRDNVYKHGAVKRSGDVLLWKENDRAATFFQLTVKVQEIFGPFITPFAAGQPPSALRAMMSNITSLYSHFNGIHGNFTSLLLGTNLTTDVDNTDSNI